MTIRKRLTLWYAGLLILIIISFGTTTFLTMRFTMIDSIDGVLRDAELQIRNSSGMRVIPGFGDRPGIDITLDMNSLDVFRASNVYVQIWLVNDPVPVLDAASANIAGRSSPLDESALGGEGDYTFGNVSITENELRVLTRPITYNDRVVGSIQVATSMEQINEVSETLLLVMVISVVFAIFGAIGLSMWFSHRALQPIEDITEAANSIAVSTDLSTRLAWDGPHDELGRLISVFNHMMSRIEQSFGVQQRFVADVSHELRTPLTAIRGNMEIIKRYGMDDEALEAIENEADRMSRLVNDLLMLARADYGGITIDLYPLDLDTVVMEVAQESRALLQNRELNFRLETLEPVRINGNADRMKQLLLNLLSNAIKFTDDGGEIRISLRNTGREAVLTVSDTGIGIAEDDLDRVFDRFYQVDTARTHTGGGFGLGLSIVRWIVEAHRGSIKASRNPGGGTIFAARFPLYEQSDDHRSHEIDDTHTTRPRLPALRRNPERAARPATRELHIVRASTRRERSERGEADDRDRDNGHHRG